MSFSLNLTQQQPQSWPRKKLDQCFSFSSAIMGGNNERQVKAGDVVVEVSGKDDQIKATLIESDGDIKLTTRGALLRPRGNFKPELMVLMLNQQWVNRSIISLDRRINTSLMGFQARSMREMEIGVPDPQTQEMMWTAYLTSARYLREQSGNFQKLGETMEKMSDAISLEILRGKLDPKQALLWVGKTMHPWQPAGAMAPAPTYTRDQVAGEEGGDEETFIRASDHRAVVAALEEEIEGLRRNQPANNAPAEDQVVQRRKPPSP